MAAAFLLTGSHLRSFTAAAAPQASPSSAPVARQRQLTRDIDTLLAARALSKGTWGISVRSLADNRSLYSTNAGKLLLPASNMKIVTLAAAAERLGWEHTFLTELRASGTIANGVLNGDLVVVGNGDPSFEDWDGSATLLFVAWAEQLRAAGITRIEGRVVGDDDNFEDERLGAGWAWDDLDRSFAAGVGALQFNENSTQVTVVPALDPGVPPAISVAPPVSDLLLRGNVRTGPARSAASLNFQRRPSDLGLSVSGSVPAGGAPVVRNVSVPNPTLYYVESLRRVLVANRIEIAGPAVDIDDIDHRPARAGEKLIASYRSAALSSIAETMMKLSQNLFAETLLRTVGMRSGVGSVEAGRVEVQSVLKRIGLSDEDVVIADGSGLSRYNLVTADALAAILTHVAKDPVLDGPFETALPIAGIDGTLERRFRGTAAEGIVHAKTGSLSNARALSGFVRPAAGEPLVFSIIANNFGTSVDAIDQAIDAIVVKLAQYATASRR